MNLSLRGRCEYLVCNVPTLVPFYLKKNGRGIHNLCGYLKLTYYYLPVIIIFGGCKSKCQ